MLVLHISFFLTTDLLLLFIINLTSLFVWQFANLMFIYLIIYYAETLLNVIFFFLGTHLLILRKQRRGGVIFVHTWSHQHSEKLGNWCSRLYSRNSNMTLIIIHIHQSRIISVWGRKEKKNGGWVGGGELVWSGRRSAKYHRKKVFALLQMQEYTLVPSVCFAQQQAEDPGCQSITEKTDQISNGNFQLSILSWHLWQYSYELFYEHILHFHVFKCVLSVING